MNNNSQESQVYIHGAPERTRSVKIIDKSKRAFDISLESTKSFELAIWKPRNSCKYRIRNIKAFFISLWTLMFRHHGIPPNADTA